MDEITITPNRDGCYKIVGKLRILTPQGKEIAHEGDTVWLCRCGQSANKPFCDGTHKRVGFTHDADEGR